MRQFDRRLAYHFDWSLLLLTFAIIAVGLATIFSATEARAHTGFTNNPLVMRQAFYAGVGFIGMVAVVLIDYRRLERYAYVVYAGTLVLLLAVPLVGSVGGGARRWIDLGPVSIQPSEMVKVSLVIALARYFHRAQSTGDVRLIDALPAFILLAIPAGLTLAQPDLGTVGVMAIVAFSVLFCAGLRLRVFFMLAAIAAGAVPLLWGHLKPYQQQRVLTFISPEMDPLGAGYHVIQSKIAIGSGMFWGKGYLHGTQNKLNFIPEQHTDFIFSVFAEEWGYVGALVLIGLVCGAGAARADGRLPRQGSLRRVAHLRRGGDRLLAGGDQRRDDVRAPAGRRNHVALLQLRRVVAHDDDDRGRPHDQREHAAVSGRRLVGVGGGRSARRRQSRARRCDAWGRPARSAGSDARARLRTASGARFAQAAHGPAQPERRGPRAERPRASETTRAPRPRRRLCRSP